MNKKRINPALKKEVAPSCQNPQIESYTLEDMSTEELLALLRGLISGALRIRIFAELNARINRPQVVQKRARRGI